MKDDIFRIKCECGKELKGFTQNQVDSYLESHLRSKEHKRIMRRSK